ncbi:MAG: DNA recombination protein RmuC, partial [Gammaproteobacteria bacterium]
RLNSLGGTLKTATNHYNDTVRSLVGQQGLYGKVNKFTELSSRISKSLPDLSTQEVDIEQDRVKLVVEEIKESQEHSDKLVKLEDKRQKE